jgi:hypothetical protein
MSYTAYNQVVGCYPDPTRILDALQATSFLLSFPVRSRHLAITHYLQHFSVGGRSIPYLPTSLKIVLHFLILIFQVPVTLSPGFADIEVYSDQVEASTFPAQLVSMHS